MNIYSFIDSPDLRFHLAHIEHEFSPYEKAWLINRCPTASWEEKCAAYQSILDEEEDCDIPKDGWFSGGMTLHELLRAKIVEQGKLLDAFYKPDGGRYTLRCFFTDGSEPWREDTVFPSPADCADMIGCCKRQNILSYIVTKHTYADRREKCIGVCFDRDDRVLRAFSTPVSWESKKLRDAFGALPLHFPYPFLHGDLVCERQSESGPARILVLDRIDPGNGDSFARGWYQEKDGSLRYEEFSLASDLTFYRGETKGKKRILTAFSHLLKNEIDPLLFAEAYHRILLEEGMKDSFPVDFGNYELARAGLTPPLFDDESDEDGDE